MFQYYIMPQRNGMRSNRGRSAFARRVMRGGPSGSNGFMPSVVVIGQDGVARRSAFYGGPKKGGAQPSGTGFMIPSGSRGATTIATPAKNSHYFFKFTEYFNRPKHGGPLL